MFIGRKQELDELNRLYGRDTFEMVIIYGRRRVGKTSLINEFCREKEHIFHVAVEQSDKDALSSFSDDILSAYPSAGSYLEAFPTWEKAFQYIVEQAGERRVVVAIDEYPYMAAGNPSLSSILQKLIDTRLSATRIFLILCGSSMSFMENQVLGYASPLYGRRTAQFKIEPFDYFESGQFFSSATKEERLEAYGIAGGIPQYLNNLAREESLADGIYRNYFRKDGHLFEEPSNILKQELREPATYNSIISAIASGAGRINEIATKTGEDSRKCSKYLNTLIDLHIVKKEYPVGMATGRNGIYGLHDNMFRFWYRFVPGNITNIEADMGRLVLERNVLPYMADYMGKIFEDICKQYMLRRNRQMSLFFTFDQIGRWWGNNPLKKRQEEIDLLAFSGTQAIFAECKWRNEPVGAGILQDLVEKSEPFACYQEKYYMLFSKTGFTSELEAVASRQSNLELVSLGQFSSPDNGGW